MNGYILLAKAFSIWLPKSQSQSIIDSQLTHSAASGFFVDFSDSIGDVAEEMGVTDGELIDATALVNCPWRPNICPVRDFDQTNHLVKTGCYVPFCPYSLVLWWTLKSQNDKCPFSRHVVLWWNLLVHVKPRDSRCSGSSLSGHHLDLAWAVAMCRSGYNLPATLHNRSNRLLMGVKMQARYGLKNVYPW